VSRSRRNSRRCSGSAWRIGSALLPGDGGSATVHTDATPTCRDGHSRCLPRELSRASHRLARTFV
jgi:hypothetical protein